MKITILGTGAYAMALANMFNYNNNDITLWSKFEDYKKNTTIEGLYTIKSIYMLLKEKNIDIPLINVIYDIVYNNNGSSNLINYITIKE